MMKLLLASASIVAFALAQAVPEFESVPSVVTAGQSYTISWQGGDGTVSGKLIIELEEMYLITS
jgi:hypothetical protein